MGKIFDIDSAFADSMRKPLSQIRGTSIKEQTPHNKEDENKTQSDFQKTVTSFVVVRDDES